MADGGVAPVRIDKWLWAARFFKTRGLAADAVKGGRVHVNGRAAKPSKDVVPGDRLEIGKGELELEVIVRGTAERRGPASVASQLYEETAASMTARERLREERRLIQPVMGEQGGRPTKRDRRRFEREAEARRRRA
ncbi:MAG TPA: RNA-binding S4 domain-containing protein [Baekduia sp.]|nr:RNA-binding S4 domain-containing protein [Baekduia sp.]